MQMKKYIKKITVVVPVLILLSIMSCGGLPYRQGGGQAEAYRSDKAAPLERAKRNYRSAASDEKTSPGGKRNGGSTADRSTQKTSPGPRIVIYHGYYTIIVESVPVALKEAGRVAKKFGGYIESSSTSDRSRRARMKLRVPVEKFNDALKACEAMGEVKSRKVRARDITREFRDTKLRLETHRRVLERLKQLLKKTRKVEERVKILREIERITSKIETLTRRLKYLRRQASYSTIYLNLKARVMGVVAGYIPSAVEWVARLKPERRTIYDDGGDIEIKDPDGFFQNRYAFYTKKRNVWLFRLPRGKAGIRVGTVKNEPEGTPIFWKEILEYELKGRKYTYKMKTEGNLSRFTVTLPDKSLYEIYLIPGKERIAVIESLFDSGKTAAKWKGTVRKMVKTVRIK